ncbi:unnamed protein product [Caenorhabditis sp. 36 PRJEB53466]|nr:unnamed protein product [Caenorhabditis sp. 36 PRJEB53466]
MQFKLFVALVVAVVTVADSVFALPLEKKADISQFTSAINGAGRLRYGKRSDPAIWEENAPSSVEEYVYPEGRYPYALIKRAFNTDSLVASLNAAERLRFGRK